VLEQILAEHLGMSMRTEGSPPRVPRELLRAGEGWKIPAELCVTPQGRVDLIRLLQPGAGRDPRVDAAILEAVRRWSYGQYVLNGVPQPFCHALIIDLAGR
jgi:outer membrane biosynthesis protein TonB